MRHGRDERMLYRAIPAGIAGSSFARSGPLSGVGRIGPFIRLVVDGGCDGSPDPCFYGASGCAVGAMP